MITSHSLSLHLSHLTATDWICGRGVFPGICVSFERVKPSDPWCVDHFFPARTELQIVVTCHDLRGVPRTSVIMKQAFYSILVPSTTLRTRSGTRNLQAT